MSNIENATTTFLRNRSVWNSLSEEAQKSLFELIGTYESPEEAYDILVGSQTQSAANKTKDHKKIEGIEDNTVGFCFFWDEA